MNISDLHRRVEAGKIFIPPLLDIVPNASQAYSLRLLNSNYSGACLSIRRSLSDLTTKDIFFKDGFVDLDEITSFANTGNAYIQTFYDQSGNNNNATTTNILNIAIMLNNNFIVNNLKICLRMNSPFNYLNNNSNSNSFYSTAVLKIESGLTGFRGIFSSSNINNAFNQHMMLANTTANKWGTFGTTTFNANSQLVGANTKIVAMESLNGLSGNFYFNGNNDGVFNSTVSQNTRRLGGIDGQTLLNTFFHEFVFYNNVPFNRSLIENNINKYYNVY